MAGFEFFNPDQLRSVINALNNGLTWAQATTHATGWNIDPTWLATQETPVKALARRQRAESAQGPAAEAELWRGAATPTIATIEPATGGAAGAEKVALYCTASGTDGFVEGVIVTFGGQEAEVLVVDPSHVLVETPAHAAGAVDVVATNPNTNADTASGGFTYS